VDCKVRSRVKLITLIWFLLGISTCIAKGQRSRTHTVPATAIPLHAHRKQEAISITFLTAPNGSPVHSLGSDQGVLDLGRFSYFSRGDISGAEIQDQKDVFTVSTRFDLRIGDLNSRRAGTATLSAFLLGATPSQIVSVDGVRLSMTPLIIGRQVPYGAVTVHVLKIVIPTSMPAGQLLDSIGVMATPN
jgi:hypothetical protein